MTAKLSFFYSLKFFPSSLSSLFVILVGGIVASFYNLDAIFIWLEGFILVEGL